jgi:hypothetical protein
LEHRATLAAIIKANIPFNAVTAKDLLPDYGTTVTLFTKFAVFMERLNSRRYIESHEHFGNYRFYILIRAAILLCKPASL